MNRKQHLDGEFKNIIHRLITGISYCNLISYMTQGPQDAVLACAAPLWNLL